MDAVAERVELDRALADAAVVLTGEGRADDQIRRGKTVAGVVERAGDRPVWVFAGEVTAGAERWAPPNVALIPIADGPGPLERSFARAADLLRRAACRTTRLWRLALVAVLVGCGATPEHGLNVPATPVHFTIEHAVGSGYRSGCVSESGVYALRAFTLERWELPAGSPPRLRARTTVGALGETALATAVGCAGDRALVVIGDEAVGVKADQVAWRGGRDQADAWPAPTTGRTPPPGTRWMERLADGREVLVGDWGRGTRKGGTFREWRATGGGMRDAAYDGTTVWAVGRSGLWRWRPSAGEPVPIPLPPALAGRPLIGLFRDTGRLWVRDAEHVGWPLDVQGSVARLIGEPGPLPPPHEALMLPVAGGRVEVQRGQPGLVVVDTDGTRRTINTGPVHSLMPLDGRRVLAAVDDAVLLWWFDDELNPRELGRIELRAPTVRLFDVEDRVVAVGPDYGFAMLRMNVVGAEPGLRPSSAGPRTSSPAPSPPVAPQPGSEPARPAPEPGER